MTSSASFHTEHVQGAARQSWRLNGPRSLLKQILDKAKDPYDRDKVHEAFMAAALPDELFGAVGDDVRRRVETMSDYWFDNNYRSAIQGYKRESPTKQQREEAYRKRQNAKDEMIKSASKTVATAISVKAQTLLLQMTMPNGRPLAECSGRELRQFKTQIPAWLHKIAERVQPREIVGKILSEEDIRKLAP